MKVLVVVFARNTVEKDEFAVNLGTLLKFLLRRLLHIIYDEERERGE